MKYLLSRILYAALISTLAIGSVSPMSTAQAAPVGSTDIKFELNVYPENLPTICVNQKLDLYVSVSKTLSKVIGGELYELPGTTTGVPRVTSSVKGPGKIQNQLGDIDAPTISQVHYTFTADKPGTATLKFSASIENSWIGAKEEVIGSGVKVEKEVTVKVRNCKYKVKTVLQFSTGFYNLAGISSEAVMIADEQGNLTGSASMSWAYSNVISGGGPCRYSMLAADSQVDLVGQLDEDGGQVMTTATFQPTTVSSTVNCGFVTGTGPDSATVHPLTFTVDSSGGVSTQTATAEGVQGGLELEGPVSGTAWVILIPEEDEAVSFIPGNQEPSWDDFSRLFGALLALH